MPDKDSIIPIERVEQCIYVIRGQKVILDADLARIYGVSTARLNQQVRRNRKKFPPDFVFELTREEFDNLMLHFATSSSGYGGRRKLPLAFTEHGAIMTATVLNSPQAVLMSVLVVRAFVQMRETFANHHELVRQFVVVGERLAHLYEGAYDQHAHQHRLRAVQHRRGHDGPVLGESVGWILAVPPTRSV